VVEKQGRAEERRCQSRALSQQRGEWRESPWHRLERRVLALAQALLADDLDEAWGPWELEE
jgi:hypothetical protein